MQAGKDCYIQRHKLKEAARCEWFSDIWRNRGPGELGIKIDQPDSHNGEFAATVQWRETMKQMKLDMEEFEA